MSPIEETTQAITEFGNSVKWIGLAVAMAALIVGVGARNMAPALALVSWKVAGWAAIPIIGGWLIETAAS